MLMIAIANVLPAAEAAPIDPAMPAVIAASYAPSDVVIDTDSVTMGPHSGGFVGACGAIAVSNDPPLQLGALLGGGFRSRKQLPVEWSARVGYLAGLLVEVSAGLGLPMPRRQEQTTP